MKLTLVALAVVLAGCATTTGTTTATGPATTTTTIIVTTTPAPTVSLVTPIPTPAPPLAPAPTTTPVTTAPPLAALQIDDTHYTGPIYHRELFPTWKDPDSNGCDAREDALIAASTMTVTRGPGCKILTGRWPLVYVPGDTTVPGDIDIDHVVPLGNAWPSGAWAWTTDQRMAFANSPEVLWAVDDGSNQAKGDKPPDRWRPPEHGVWCQYARRWVSIKVAYHLTATTSERESLGQMLDTCPK